MERAITAYHQDEVPEWVAELECGHKQHVRHRPPFQLRAWINEEAGRRAKLGLPLDCPLCDRAEMPEGLNFVRSSPEWTEQTVPQGLLRAHRLAHGTWGRIVVQSGTLRFTMFSEPRFEVVLRPGSDQSIPPTVEHEVRVLGPVRFTIDFFAVDGAGTSPADREDRNEGGDPACWAGLLCPECGAVLDGGAHRPYCQQTTQNRNVR